MSKNYQILVLSPERDEGVKRQIAQWEIEALATLENLKNRFLVWQSVKSEFPKFARFTPYKTVKDLVGKELYDSNEVAQKDTLNYIALISGLIKGDLIVVPTSTDGGQTIELAAIEPKKYLALTEPGSFGMLFAFGLFVIVAASAVIAVIVAWKGLDAYTAKLNADAKKTEGQTRLKATELCSQMSKISPEAGKVCLKWWADREAKAAATDSRSWLDKATESLKTIGVSGFGGLALGLFLALSMQGGRRKR